MNIDRDHAIHNIANALAKSTSPEFVADFLDETLSAWDNVEELTAREAYAIELLHANLIQTCPEAMTVIENRQKKNTPSIVLCLACGKRPSTTIPDHDYTPLCNVCSNNQGRNIKIGDKVVCEIGEVTGYVDAIADELATVFTKEGSVILPTQQLVVSTKEV